MSVVVAGGTRGIGRAIALHFARPGSELVLAYARDRASAEATRTEVEARGARAHLVQVDLGTPGGCARLASAVAEVPGAVELVVHSAVRVVAAPLMEVDLDAFARAVELNGTSLLYLVRALLPRMRRGSSIVYLSSRGGRVVIPNYAAVGVAKALAESLMRYLAVELAPRGIRINAVAPGIVDTGAVRAVFGEETDAILRHAAEANPSGRAIRDEDYTAVVEFLASPAARFVQGQVIAVNGGHNLMG